jgi:hemoglobin
MSKLELQKAALERSGVSYEESLVATEQLQPSIYERLGQEGLRSMSEAFYNRVFEDKETTWFLNIFSSSTRTEAIENQYLFFVQTFGGPDLYRQKKGKYTRLVGRHANYNIGAAAANRWVEHMKAVLQEHELLSKDAEAADALDKYFRYTAHYIVVASEYMRPDQVRANWRGKVT